MSTTYTPDPHFYWKHAGQELRGLQDRITGYKHRFEDVGRKDISDGLEEAIRLHNGGSTSCRGDSPGTLIFGPIWSR